MPVSDNWIEFIPSEVTDAEIFFEKRRLIVAVRDQVVGEIGQLNGSVNNIDDVIFLNIPPVQCSRILLRAHGLYRAGEFDEY